MEKLIDIHVHLGDILEGKNIIHKKGVVKKLEQGLKEDPLDIIEANDFSYDLVEESEDIVISQRARGFTATLENLQRNMDATNYDCHCCPMPVYPWVSFEEVLAASKIEERILPFTSIDYTLGEKAGEKLLEDLECGAQGLKIHPILASRSLLDELTIKAVEYWNNAKIKKPILIHTGISSYHLGGAAYLQQRMEFGNVESFADLARQFPEINFIAGHGGLFSKVELYNLVKDLKNVYVDTSFSNMEIFQFYFDTYGSEKMLYGSDWPYGSMQPSIKVLKLACKGDKELENMLFYENAKNLLNL